MSRLLGDRMNYLLLPIAVGADFLLCCTELHVLEAQTLVAFLALSRFAVLLLTTVRTFAHMCGVAAVVSIVSPVPEPFFA